jgi:Lar family restriction alleviation protein
MANFFDEAIKAGMQARAKALKPCPFCGSQNVGLHQETTTGDEFIMYIECHACGARGSVKHFPRVQFADIRSTWNDRAEKTLDDYIFRGGTLREWVEKIERGEIRAERHGKWEEKFDYTRCTKCGGLAPIKYDWSEDLTEYCPNCGAKMDGGADRMPRNPQERKETGRGNEE